MNLIENWKGSIVNLDHVVNINMQQVEWESEGNADYGVEPTTELHAVQAWTESDTEYPNNLYQSQHATDCEAYFEWLKQQLVAPIRLIRHTFVAPSKQDSWANDSDGWKPADVAELTNGDSVYWKDAEGKIVYGYYDGAFEKGDTQSVIAVRGDRVVKDNHILMVPDDFLPSLSEEPTD